MDDTIMNPLLVVPLDGARVCVLDEKGHACFALMDDPRRGARHLEDCDDKTTALMLGFYTVVSNMDRRHEEERAEACLSDPDLGTFLPAMLTVELGLDQEEAAGVAGDIMETAVSSGDCPWKIAAAFVSGAERKPFSAPPDRELARFIRHAEGAPRAKSTAMAEIIDHPASHLRRCRRCGRVVENNGQIVEGESFPSKEMLATWMRGKVCRSCQEKEG